ncbi:MAG: signal peptidase I [Nanoarchaeota archaeon]
MSSIRKIWNFIWYDNSLFSWIVNIILALIIVKFIIYPGLGLIFSTSHPLVAVVSSSMEHNNQNFDDWWLSNRGWYEENGITKDQFEKFRFKNGFNKGDIMVLFGSEDINVGEVIVYNGGSTYPIIHRVVDVTNSEITLKGDNNKDKDPSTVSNSIGKAIIRIPFLGYVKILFVNLIINPLQKLLI